MAGIKDVLQTDIGYTAWANQELLRACSALTAEQLERDLGASHASILKTFRHIYYTERVWIQRLEASALPPMIEVGDQRIFGDRPPEPSFNELIERWPQVWEGYRTWLANIDEAALEARLPSSMPDGAEYQFTKWEIVVHSVNHSTLHRGQIISMIRALGLKPPNVDEFSFYMARA